MPDEAFVERRPWMLDDYLYPVADRTLQEDGSLFIRDLKRGEFPTWAVRSKFNKWFINRGFNTRWRCAITDVQCYLVERIMLEGIPLLNAPWAVSSEHLVANHLRSWHDDHEHDELNTRLNLITLGQAINHNVGHIPLALKLLHRKTFQAMNFGQNPATLDTFREAKKVIIRIEEGLFYEGKYPWQPWTYTDDGHRKVAEAFMSEMIDFHREFFKIPYRERQVWFDAFEWRW